MLHREGQLPTICKTWRPAPVRDRSRVTRVHRPRAGVAARHPDVPITSEEITLRVRVQRTVDRVGAEAAGPAPVRARRRVTRVHRPRAGVAARHPDVPITSEEITLRVRVQRTVDPVGAEAAGPAPVRDRSRVTRVHRPRAGVAARHPDVPITSEEITLRPRVQRTVDPVGAEAAGPAPVRDRSRVTRVHRPRADWNPSRGRTCTPLAPGEGGAGSGPAGRQAAGVGWTALAAACPPRSTLLSVSKSSGTPLANWRRGHVQTHPAHRGARYDGGGCVRE